MPPNAAALSESENTSILPTTAIMPVVFLDLPLEILPEIFSHIVKPQHLTSLCLVNNSFRTFAVCKLYERVSIYFTSPDKGGRYKAIKLFDTLSCHPYLALLVYHLEIRENFRPLDDDLPCHVLSGLKNCVNLRSCAWTRDGSLNSNILEILHQCKNLRELQLNVFNDGLYDAQLLLKFTELHRISLIRLSSPVVRILKPWLSATGATLKSLSLICKSSGILTDQILEAIAPSLVNLEYLGLSNCYHVTHRGVWAIVSSSTNGILGLAHEGVNHSTYDMAAFADLCFSSGALRRLRSFMMYLENPMCLGDSEWVKHVVRLLSDSPLETFQIGSTYSAKDVSITDELWTPLLSTHGKRLLRITLPLALISWEAINSICVKCTKLEYLFFTVRRGILDLLGPCLSLAKALRTIHINYTPGQSDPLILPQSQALSILNKCSPTVTQFGCNGRVWQVSRAIEVNEDGSMEAHRTLGPFKYFNVRKLFLEIPS